MILSASLILLILVKLNEVVTLNNNCSNLQNWWQEHNKNGKAPAFNMKFKWSCEFVTQHNAKAMVSFTLGLNQFAINDFEKNLKPKDSNPRLSTHKHSTDEFNWLQQKPKLGSLAIRNQKNCQNCYVMSAVAAVEAWRVIYKDIVTNISVANVQQCLKKNCGQLGNVSEALSHLQTSEIVPEDQSPYPLNPGNGISKNCIRKDSISKNNFAFKQLSNYSLNDMKPILRNNGPIAIGIYSALPTFMLYNQGIFEDVQCNPAQDHSALLVGYGYDRKRNKSFWLIKNSWGERWGEGGFVRVTQDPERNCLKPKYAFYIVKPDLVSGTGSLSILPAPRSVLPAPRSVLPSPRSYLPPRTSLPSPIRQPINTFQKTKLLKNRANLVFIYPFLLFLNFAIAYYI